MKKLIASLSVLLVLSPAWGQSYYQPASYEEQLLQQLQLLQQRSAWLTQELQRQQQLLQQQTQVVQQQAITVENHSRSLQTQGQQMASHSQLLQNNARQISGLNQTAAVHRSKLGQLEINLIWLFWGSVAFVILWFGVMWKVVSTPSPALRSQGIVRLTKARLDHLENELIKKGVISSVSAEPGGVSQSRSGATANSRKPASTASSSSPIA